MFVEEITFSGAFWGTEGNRMNIWCGSLSESNFCQTVKGTLSRRLVDTLAHFSTHPKKIKNPPPQIKSRPPGGNEFGDQIMYPPPLKGKGRVNKGRETVPYTKPTTKPRSQKRSCPGHTVVPIDVRLREHIDVAGNEAWGRRGRWGECATGMLGYYGHHVCCVRKMIH